MLRAVLAVLLAAALVGVSMGALQDARQTRSDRLAAGEVGALRDAAVGLQQSAAPAPRAAVAARRVVDVAVPTGGFTEAPVAYVAVGGRPGKPVPGDDGGSDVVAYRLADGPPRTTRLPVDVRAAGRGGDDTPLVLRGPARVALSLVERRDRPVVLVERVGRA